MVEMVELIRSLQKLRRSRYYGMRCNSDRYFAVLWVKVDISRFRCRTRFFRNKLSDVQEGFFVRNCVIYPKRYPPHAPAILRTGLGSQNSV